MCDQYLTVRVSENREVREVFGSEDGENSTVRNDMIGTLTKYYPCPQVKKVEIGWAFLQ
jgi:hypothetical protein